MHVRQSIAAFLLTLLPAGSASAQVLSLEFRDGRVRLVAENVPVSQILSEWSRVGGTKIVNGERIPGPPVSVQLTDVSERHALDVVLRGAAGYMVAAHETPRPGASAFDRILVLPTTSRAPSTAALPPPPPVPRFPNDDDVVEEPEPVDDPSSGVLPPIRRGRLPQDGPLPQFNAEDDETEAETAPLRAEPGNPFGVMPGSSRPGTIATPPRRNDDDNEN
jgi:hypothetical protein